METAKCKIREASPKAMTRQTWTLRRLRYGNRFNVEDDSR